MPREQRAEAVLLANDMEDKRLFALHVSKYRDQANYEFWEKRAEAEQTPVALAARRQLYQADKLLGEGDLETRQSSTKQLGETGIKCSNGTRS